MSLRTVFVCALLGACASAQPLRTRFEAPQWPAWNTIPANYTQVLTTSGATLTYTFNGWQFSAGDADLPYPGGQGTVARALNGQVPELTFGTVIDPVAVRFKLAAGATAPTCGPADWTLELHAVIPNAPNVPNAPDVMLGTWTNRIGLDLPAAKVWTVITAPLDLPPGAHTLRLRLFPRPGLSNPPLLALDDLEVFRKGDTPKPEDPPSLQDLKVGLKLNPPSLPMTDDIRVQRHWMIGQLDRWASAEHVKFQQPGGVAAPSVFTNWYRAQMREAVNHLKTCQPGIAEACITKLYSSGFVVHTRNGTFGVDVTEGPNLGSSQIASTIAMSAPWDVMLSLSLLLDFLLVTHHHHDHCCYPLINLMWVQGKPTYGPSAIDGNDGLSILEEYLLYNGPAAPYIPALNAMIDPVLQQTSDTLGTSVAGQPGWRLRSFKGRQSMDPLHACGSGPPSLQDPLNYSYQLTSPDGLGFMVVGDQREHFDWTNAVCGAEDPILTLDTNSPGWWPRLASAGVTIDLKLGFGPLINGLWRTRLQGHFGPLVVIDGHEWEMTHPRINVASAFWARYPPEREQTVPLSVGEHIHYRSFPVVPHVSQLAAATATISFTTALPLDEVEVHYRPSNGAWASATTVHASPSFTHTVSLAPLVSQTQHFYYITTRTRAPGLLPSPLLNGPQHAGPRYASSTAPRSFTTP